MKTKLLIISVVLFFGAASFVGCKKTTNDLPSDNLYSKIGYYHNEVLKRYISNNKSTNKSSDISNYRNIQTKVVDILCNLDSSLFNKKDIEYHLKRSDEVLNKLGIMEIFSNKSTSLSKINKDYFSKILDFLLKNNRISLELSNQLNEINTITFQNTNSDAKILSIVNELKNRSWSDKDSKFVNTFVQVYDSSYLFWHNKSAGFKSLKHVNNAETFMLADAAGALYGLWLGPVTSIVEGAVFSTIEYANEQSK
ncbi:hypothetical protein MNBD_BACTEROID07-387 [hydrothermal vent metagenome]|uniref:Lipoprotein n=1 Tax=hydrothermal vent metagenome TaxID=652676 RepID=A0A3B0UAM7_9ZZZZ